MNTAPDSTALWLTRGHILNDHDLIEEALFCYRNAIVSDPQCEAALSSIISTLEREGRLSKSIDIAIEAIRAKVGLLNEVTFESYERSDLDRLIDAFEDHHSKSTTSQDI